MRLFAFLTACLLPLSVFADPLECLDKGTVEQIAENMPHGSVVYRDCYHCQSPAYEVIEIEKTKLRPCHMHGSPSDRALYVSGKIKRRFQMEKCGEPTNEEQVQAELRDELLVLNYAWLYEPKTREATNIADMFGENSHHLCKRFVDRDQKLKTRRAKKAGG